MKFNSQVQMNTPNRIQKQFAELEKTKIGNYLCSKKVSALEWMVTVIAPKESPYDGLRLQLLFKFPNDYPQQPPEVTPQTFIHHINLKQGCRASLTILNDDWSAFLNISKVLMTIQAVLMEPDQQYPIDATLLEMYQEDPAQFDKRGKMRLMEGSVEDVPDLSQIKSRPTLHIDAFSEYQQRIPNKPVTKKSTSSSAVVFQRQQSRQPLPDLYPEMLKLCKDEIGKISAHCLQLEEEYEVAKNQHVRKAIDSELEGLSSLRQRVWEKYLQIQTRRLEEILHL